MKTILTSILAIIIATGTPVNYIECDYGKCINTYKENGTQYSAIKTTSGDLWIVEGKIVKKKRLLVVFDNKGTNCIYDDEVVYITTLGK